MVIVPPNAVDCPAIVIELFVKDELPMFDKVFEAPLIVLFVKATDAVANEAVYISKLSVSLSKVFNLLIALPLAVDNWSNLLFCVVLIVSFEAVYEFNDVNILTTCAEPETTLLPCNSYLPS